ncbi:MAG: hypothetical protein ACUVQF_05095 [Fervidobacterium sp.]|uniref:hypothetical protein n=1 Tax=Fervidobacterium sp. TaxID=1871331 RepID=UPI004049929F
MKSQLKILVFFMFLVITGVVFPYYTRWLFGTEVDVMTDKIKFWYAISPETAPLEKVAFPYENIRAAVFVKYDGNQLTSGIVFNLYPPIPGGVVSREESDEGIPFETRIRWDNQEPVKVKFFQPVLSKMILFDRKITIEIVNKLMKHNTLIVELDWLLWGVKHFKFSLDGSKDAISQVLRKIKK